MVQIRACLPDGTYRYGYQGDFAETDPETGKPAFELRLYDPRINRWLSPDPYGQFHSPYLAMDNRPNMLVDPDGGCTVGVDCPTEFDWMGAGTTVLNEFVGTPNGVGSGGVNWFSESITGGGLIDFSLASASVWEDISARFDSKIPYLINQNFPYTNTDIDYGISSWGKVGSTFVPRGTGGGVTVVGTIDANARITYSGGNFVLNVNASHTVNNDPRNKSSAFLNVKYTNDNTSRLATTSLGLNRDKPMLSPIGITYLGEQSLILPSNLDALSRLNLTIGVHQRLPGGGASNIALRANLLQDIVNRR
ncbi:RHS repeat-associated core domain-containing protein [Leptobacterium sp. I13]|uniref:RHS repeat-associated core domain-containing protein n=1 Tax=Leptobacterium meishanense TaxID=3128904 RepID=UPI0030ED0280